MKVMPRVEILVGWMMNQHYVLMVKFFLIMDSFKRVVIMYAIFLMVAL